MEGFLHEPSAGCSPDSLEIWERERESEAEFHEIETRFVI